MALGGLAMLGLALGAGFARRRKLMMAMMAVSIMVLGYSCTKSDKAAIQNNDNLFVRIAQVDKDGTKSYSKVVKVVKK
ncbi:MAG TPA: hypothetical protein PK110_14055 [Niabella sp.]|nr:hypothetical protein [Chitinophagaceae bacterium]HRN46990.1 hypothetical protein [Niabella sp.]HRO85944.1 hypothetical protein [Niabella sp.]HUN03276.1 hypothetical protein [Niabella sp.]